MNTPNYIKAMVHPTTQKAQGRKVWSIDLKEVWIPFFVATNAQGDTAIPSAALGCPLRLGYDKAGEVRFSQSGRPIYRIAKELSDGVKMVRDNQIAGMLAFVGEVAESNPDGYKAQIDAANKAGTPIIDHDNAELSKALEAIAEAAAEAEKEATADTDTETKEAVLVS